MGGVWWREGLALAVTFVDVGCARTRSNGGVEPSKVSTTPETEVLGCYAGTSLPSIFRLLCAEILCHQHIVCFPRPLTVPNADPSIFSAFHLLWGPLFYQAY